MQLNYFNRPHFENGAIEKISKVLKSHGIKNPLICSDPGLSSIGMTKKIDVEEAIKIHKDKSAIFIDVRDSSDISKTGSIEGSLKIQRGLIEFVADENTDFYNEKLKKDSEIILVCGAGGQAALTGKTLIDMGYTNVSNVGAIGDWEKNGGPINK